MPRKRPALLGALLLVTGLPAAHAATPDEAIGRWIGADGPDTASRLELMADGQFRYGLSEGALDEGAAGRWRREGTIIRLVTEPNPTPPAFTVESMSPSGTTPLSIVVRTPDGQGIPGIWFHLDYDNGPPVDAYTQYDGWTGDPADGRVPRWVELREPVHDIRSQRLPVPPGARAMRFILQPNDIGIVDFRESEVRVEGNELSLRTPRWERHFVRFDGR